MTTAILTVAVVEPTAAGTDDGFEHLIGPVYYWLERLGLKEPRALCGQSPASTDATPIIDSDSRPTCPVCAAKAGWRT